LSNTDKVAKKKPNKVQFAILPQTRPPRPACTRLPREAQAGMVAGVGRKVAKFLNVKMFEI
jgi:hypothetical protein